MWLPTSVWDAEAVRIRYRYLPKVLHLGLVKPIIELGEVEVQRLIFAAPVIEIFGRLK